MRRFYLGHPPLRRCFSALPQNEVAAVWPSVLAYADGASRGNPGRSGCGALLMDPATGRVLATATKYVGDQETNNAAEYHGLLLALRLAQRHQATHVHVHMDSQLIVRQMEGQYRVKAANLRRLYQQCKELSAALPHVTFSHVAREENAAADRLANDAIDEYEAIVTK
ncbi:Ribonuclease HI [Phytophthora megakarya]|uniref:Ribonuclease HI n=1 Tax=Phytophthora megakarya TaxID=4795 RepID=A0A225WQN7_9STRA|nr:Ribonuclease HI [Phytophthora megakarya]